jgi:signal transduction histidine kinase
VNTEQSPANLPSDDETFARERFLMRARALFFARAALLGIGLCILLVPAWRTIFQVDSLGTIGAYLVMVAYSAANYVLLERGRLGAVITYLTLCFDLGALLYLIIVTGGLHSPLLATELLFTTLFVTLFPRPIAIVPPLLTFPVVAKIQEMLTNGAFYTEDLFLLIWYSLINCIVVYVVVYLHTRDEMKHREILRLQQSLKEMAVIEERTRLAREIHDGLGGSLSSLIIQTEYLQGLAREEPLRSEIGELKLQAEESIDELRRALTMMRDDFDLVRGVEDACRKFESRQRGLVLSFLRVGRERQISSESALTVFRVLQESLANIVKHSKATQVSVTLRFTDTECELIVQDNGQGFDCAKPPPIGHYGLLNMGERAQRVGGSARVESAPGAGTIVTLAVPLAHIDPALVYDDAVAA